METMTNSISTTYPVVPQSNANREPEISKNNQFSPSSIPLSSTPIPQKSNDFQPTAKLSSQKITQPINNVMPNPNPQNKPSNYNIVDSKNSQSPSRITPEVNDKTTPSTPPKVVFANPNENIKIQNNIPAQDNKDSLTKNKGQDRKNSVIKVNFT